MVIARYGSLLVPDASAAEPCTDSLPLGLVPSASRFDTGAYLVSPLLLIPATSTATLQYLPLTHRPACSATSSRAFRFHRPHLPRNETRGNPQGTGIAAWSSFLARVTYSRDSGSGQALEEAGQALGDQTPGLEWRPYSDCRSGEMELVGYGLLLLRGEEYRCPLNPPAVLGLRGAFPAAYSYAGHGRAQKSVRFDTEDDCIAQLSLRLVLSTSGKMQAELPGLLQS